MSLLNFCSRSFTWLAAEKISHATMQSDIPLPADIHRYLPVLVTDSTERRGTVHHWNFSGCNIPGNVRSDSAIRGTARFLTREITDNKPSGCRDTARCSGKFYNASKTTIINNPLVISCVLTACIWAYTTGKLCRSF